MSRGVKKSGISPSAFFFFIKSFQRMRKIWSFSSSDKKYHEKDCLGRKCKLLFLHRFWIACKCIVKYYSSSDLSYIGVIIWVQPPRFSHIVSLSGAFAMCLCAWVNNRVHIFVLRNTRNTRVLSLNDDSLPFFLLGLICKPRGQTFFS